MRRRTKTGDRNMVGNAIVRLRNEKNIAQGELLSRIQLQGVDMNQAKLSRIEGQRIAVADHDLFAIAKALNVSTDALFEQHIMKEDSTEV